MEDENVRGFLGIISVVMWVIAIGFFLFNGWGHKTLLPAFLAVVTTVMAASRK